MQITKNSDSIALFSNTKIAPKQGDYEVSSWPFGYTKRRISRVPGTRPHAYLPFSVG